MIEQINPQDNFNISINNNQSNNRINSSALSNSIMNNDIINQLIEFGYSSLYSKRIFQYYHPKNIQEAVDYLSFEDGKIQHVFVQDRNNNENSICYLCGEQKDIHLADQIDNSLSEDIKSSIRKSFLENRSKLKKSNGSIKKTNCPACEEDFIPNDKNTLKNCGHSFCDECWYDFLSIKIKENKLNFIKCMDYECREKPDDDFIINLLNSNQELIDKYKKFKLELEIINDPNRKFCPFPNCNSFLELKDKNNKEVKCSNNHIFCFLCLKSPHGNLPCNNEINKSMVEYEKKNFVKKCPRCDIITEKITGCNHITCAKCNYQWCWLCNGEYDPEHFYEGKCRGLQFFRPKDENEIKLAQEGKIELRESQRQDDLDSENSDDEGVNNFNNSNLFNSFNIINIDIRENNENNNHENNRNNENNSNNLGNIRINENSLINLENFRNNENSSIKLENNSSIANEKEIVNNNIINSENIENNENNSDNLNNNGYSSNEDRKKSINTINSEKEENYFHKGNIDNINYNENKNYESNENNNNSIDYINNKINDDDLNNLKIDNIYDKINNNNNNPENSDIFWKTRKSIVKYKKNINKKNNIIYRSGKENNDQQNKIISPDSKTDRGSRRFMDSYSVDTKDSINNSQQSINIDNKNNEEEKNKFNNDKNDVNNLSIENNEEENNNFNNDNFYRNSKRKEYNDKKENNEEEKNKFNNDKNDENNLSKENNNFNNDNFYRNSKRKEYNDKKDENSINIENKEDEKNNNNDKNNRIIIDINKESTSYTSRKNNNAIGNNNLNESVNEINHLGEQGSKEKILKISNKNKEKHQKDKTKNFNIPNSILITFIYLIFGHFFIPANIYLIEKNLEKSFLILTSIILIIIPFFFIQIIFNLILLIFYIKINGYKPFLSEFYYNIKMKKDIYKINLIDYNAYHILVFLFLATFCKIIKTFQKAYGNKIFINIIGFILGLMILPLHLIINPFLLYDIIKKDKKEGKNDFNLLKQYIYDL